MTVVLFRAEGGTTTLVPAKKATSRPYESIFVSSSATMDSVRVQRMMEFSGGPSRDLECLGDSGGLGGTGGLHTLEAPRDSLFTWMTDIN